MNTYMHVHMYTYICGSCGAWKCSTRYGSLADIQGSFDNVQGSFTNHQRDKPSCTRAFRFVHKFAQLTGALSCPPFICTYARTHPYVYVYTYTQTHMYIYICMYIYTYMCVCIFMYIYIYMYIDMNTQTHAHTHKYISNTSGSCNALKMKRVVYVFVLFFHELFPAALQHDA